MLENNVLKHKFDKYDVIVIKNDLFNPSLVDTIRDRNFTALEVFWVSKFPIQSHVDIVDIVVLKIGMTAYLKCGCVSDKPNKISCIESLF